MIRPAILGIALLTCGAWAGQDAFKSYAADVEKWRAEQEASLKGNEGWLTVSGLYWLKQGEEKMGTDPSCGILLPKGSAPPVLGTVTFHDGRVTFKAAPGVQVKANGQMVDELEMGGSGLRVGAGSLTFTVIQRGQRTGIRLFDSQSRALREFKGERWFPVDEKYRIEARFVSYPTPRTMPITNVLGDTSPVPNPGFVEFTIDGKLCRLEAQSAGPGLFFNFRDRTTGHETYPAGRFLDAPAPTNGKVLLDFNKATNPPCAFTEFATCPLPPLANYLKVRIPAGEKTHHPTQ